MTPRPILKHFPPHSLTLDSDSSGGWDSSPDLFTLYSGALPFSSSRNIPPLESPHVHFPPTPILSQMGMTHSSYSYDRHPIEVLPNSLALPRRGTRDVDERMDESEMRSTNFDDYFSLDEHIHAIQDVNSFAAESSRESILFESETNTGIFPIQMVPFENIQNHSRNFNDVCTHDIYPSLDHDPSTESSSELYGSLPSNELSASISISISFSRLSDQSHVPSSNLTRKRDADDCHFENRKKVKARRKHAVTKPKMYFQEEDMSSELDEDKNLSSGASSIGAGYDLSLGRVLNRTKHSMDAIMNDSSSISACGVHFSSFCDSRLEGCLGGF